MKKMLSAQFLLCLLCLLVFGSGCELQEMLTNQEKVVKRRIDRLKVIINNSEWASAKQIVSPELVWTPNNGLVVKPKKIRGKIKPRGRSYWQKSIDDLPKDRMGFIVEVRKMKKINETRYLAEVRMRLRIRKYASDMDNIIWDTMQTWDRDPKSNEWLLTDIKDITTKEGSRGSSYQTDPVIPERLKAKVAKSKGARFAGRSPMKSIEEFEAEKKKNSGGLVDYATGYTPLKQKQKSKTKIGKLSKKRERQYADEYTP